MESCECQSADHSTLALCGSSPITVPRHGYNTVKYRSDSNVKQSCNLTTLIPLVQGWATDLAREPYVGVENT
ncbi:hypothetical protein TNCV_419521 [Trichonephila clavipes]|uniref:Uncharacterized protein n=1 Tax=Trichonephila clavipes TaxID=2585209 RepID=A0A8X6S2R8_TRICX|nr:hypothetical protein TNCV_419521 [Trichonephila clavipes]